MLGKGRKHGCQLVGSRAESLEFQVKVFKFNFTDTEEAKELF